MKQGYSAAGIFAAPEFPVLILSSGYFLYAHSTHVPISLCMHLSLMWQLLMVSTSLIALDCAAALYQLTWRVLIKDSLWQEVCPLILWVYARWCAKQRSVEMCHCVCVYVCTHCACMCTHSPTPATFFVRMFNSVFFLCVCVFSFFKIRTPWFYHQRFGR